jgi:hypothetical protein
MQNKTRLEPQEFQVPEHAKTSPFSQSLQELIATAGGIYLSLILLVSFLHIEIADRWLVFGVKMDPLAFTALALSLVQPVFLRIISFLKGDS